MLTVPTEGTSATGAVERDVLFEVTILSLEAPAAEHAVASEGGPDRADYLAYRHPADGNEAARFCRTESAGADPGYPLEGAPAIRGRRPGRLVRAAPREARALDAAPGVAGRGGTFGN